MALVKTELAARRSMPLVDRWALAVSIAIAAVLLLKALYVS